MIKKIFIVVFTSILSLIGAYILSDIVLIFNGFFYFPSLIFFFIIIEWLLIRKEFNVNTSSGGIRENLRIILITAGILLIGYIAMMFYVISHLTMG